MSKFLHILNMKPPAQLVYELYDAKSPRTFQHDLQLHLAHGYVFSTPEEFFMGRPVESNADAEDIRSPAVVFDREDCDCWYIYAYATRNPCFENWVGLVEKVLRWMPYELPLAAWERRKHDRMLFFPIKRFQQLTKQL